METPEENEECEKLPPVQDAQEESEDEDDTEEALEAATIFVLMSKRFRLSRNARAQWLEIQRCTATKCLALMPSLRSCFLALLFLSAPAS